MKWYTALSALFLSLLPAAARASTVDAMSLEDLQDRSALVVLGQVTDTEVVTESGTTLVHTEITVSECLAGLCPGDVTVTSPGGTTDVTEGAPRFEEGQQVLVFLRPENGRFAVVGMAQGLFRIEQGSEGPIAVSDRSGLVMLEPSGRPSLVERVAYPLDELVDSIRLGTPVNPLAHNQ